MWRISLMAAAHGDPLRQSQRRSRHGDTREDLYPIDFQAYQMSPTCGSGYRCPPSDDPIFGLMEDTTLPSNLAVVSQDVFYPQDMDKPIEKPPTVDSEATKKVSRNMPFRLTFGARRFCSSLRDRWRKFTWKRFHGSKPEPALPSKSPAPQPGSTSSLDSSSSRCCRNFISIDPTLPFHYRWMVLVSLAVLYNLIFVLGRAVFWELNNAVPKLWWFLDYTSDAIYVIDSIIHAHEGYLEQGLLVNDSSKLRKHYMATGRWKTDVLSLIPTDIAYYWWPPYSCLGKVPCPVIVRANRLFRLPRMCEFFDRTETGTGYPNAFRICKVVLAILVLIHWNACFYFAISYVIGFGTDNWVYNTRGEKNSTLTRQYIYSFYWSTLTLTTIGETPQPENDAEYLFVVADFLAGVLIFATIVGNIGSMISNMNLARVDFQNRMDGVKQYMAFRKVSKDLEARVIRWFAYTWANKQALDEDRVLAALPDKLKAEIAIHVHLDTLKQVQIFQDCEPGLLEELVLKLRLQVFSPGDYICRKGDVGKEMYIVKRGRLSVVADDGVTVLATLGSGSVFGEVSVLEIAGNRTGNRRTANVRSLGYSDLFCLAKRDLWEALVDYPEARHSLMERGCQLLRKDGLLDENAFKKSQAEHETLKDKVDRLENSLEGLEEKLSQVVEDLSAFHVRMKRRASRIEHKNKHSSPTMKAFLMPKSTTVEEEEEGGDGSMSRRSFQGASRPNMSEVGYCPETVKTWSNNSIKLTKSESFFPKGFSMVALPEQRLREVTPDKMKSKTWELIQNKTRYTRMMQMRSFLRDELDFLKINMSTHDKILEFFSQNEVESKKQMKQLLRCLGKQKKVNKLVPAKVKDLLTAIEGSEAAKTDTKIWKFLKRSSSLRNEFSSTRQYLIEIHAWHTTDSHYQSSKPSKVTCPNCRFFITTNIKRVSTIQTKIASSLFAIFSLFLMPNTLNCFKGTIHLCPLCKIYLGFCPALRIRNIRKRCMSRNKGSESLSLEMMETKSRKMVSASSTSAKNLFVESKLRLSDRVQVNVNNIATIARQIQRGSKANENLMAAAKNFAIQEAAIENSETNLKKLKLLTTHINSQLESLQNSSSKMELVLEQVRSMQR